MNKLQDKLNKELYYAARNGDKEKAKMYFKRTNVVPDHFRITNQSIRITTKVLKSVILPVINI